MGDIFKQTADELIAHHVKVWTSILPLYPDALSKAVTAGRESLVRNANYFDEALDKMISRLASARQVTQLKAELSLVRMKAFQLFQFVIISKRLLKIVKRELYMRGILATVSQEALQLDITLSFVETDELLSQLAERGLIKRKAQELSGGKLLLRTVLTPLGSYLRFAETRAKHDAYSKAIADFIKTSSKGISKLLFLSGRDLLLRFCELIAPTAFVLLLVYLSHAIAELLGLHFVAFHWRTILIAGLVILVLHNIEKISVRLFRRYYLNYYRRKCLHTAVRVYDTSLRVRAALIGLAELAIESPKVDKAEGNQQSSL
jgi:hypothetical protein